MIRRRRDAVVRPTRGPGVGRAPGVRARVLAFGVLVVVPSAVVGQSTGGAPGDTLTLGEALREALESHPDVRAARADVTAGTAARWADWGAFLPSATADLTLSRTRFTTSSFLSPEGLPRTIDPAIEDVSKSVSQGLSFRWNLLEGGRRVGEARAGAADLAAARLGLSDTERAVAARVKGLYFEAAKERRLVEIARGQLGARRRELNRMRRRYRIAAARRADLLGAEMQVRRAELVLLEARDRAERTRRLLAAAMGESGDASRVVAIGPESVVSDGPSIALSADVLVRRALESHPGLRSDAARIRAASARVGRASRSYLPTIGLSYRISRSEQLPESGSLLTFDPSNRATGLSVSVGWELFGGFRRREQAGRARATLQRARADEARRRLEIERRVRDLVDEVTRRAHRLELLERQLAAGEERRDLVREEFRLGTADFPSLRTVIDEVTRTERRLVEERYDYLATRARLERWAGEGVADPPAGRPGTERPPPARR